MTEVEVIDLCSSPLRSLPTGLSSQKHPSTAEDVFDLNFDDFESTRDLSFTLPSLSKRRKLNGPVAGNVSRSGRNSRATSLQPASDEDGLPTLGFQITKQSTKRKSIEFELADSITFSSSAPQPKTTSKAASTTVYDVSSDDIPDDIFSQLAPSASQPSINTTSRQPLSERTANLLAELSRNKPSGGASKAPSKRANQFRMPGASSAGASVVDDIFVSSPPEGRNAKSSKSKLSEAEKAIRAAGRAEAGSI